MADPFEALRAPITPVDPDREFAARLRARVETALRLPKGVTVSNLTLESDVTTASRAVPSVVPYLAVAGADRALSWYKDALGARLHGEPYVMADGRIGHAELDVAGGLLMLCEEHPEIGVVAPTPGQGVPVTIHLSVTDVDEVIERALDEGAVLERAAADYEYGRNAVFRDPFGHRWLVSAEPAHDVAGFRHGDVGYVSLWVPDVERAASFFSSVLGWHYGPASGPEGRQVVGQNLHHGLWGNQPRSTLFLCFAVDHLASAIERVLEGGGTADTPREEPYGLVSGCTDDQGASFALFEPPGGIDPRAGGGPPNGTINGDVSYLTMEVVDSEKARAFYGAVLGWRFEPGQATDGWQVSDVVPMLGISGGHDSATTVPMYRVDDIAAAVDRVRARGGTASDPEHRPYGATSTCADDQGTRFYLGE